MIGTGSAPLSSRQDLVRCLEAGPRSAAVGGLIAALRGAGALTPDEATGAWIALISSTRLMTDADMATAALALHRMPFRDTLIAWMTPNALSPDLAEQSIFGLLSQVPEGEDSPEVTIETITARLVDLVSCLPDDEAAPALTVLANYAWSNGKGAIASISLERALRVRPDYRLAQLLNRMVALGIRLE